MKRMLLTVCAAFVALTAMCQTVVSVTGTVVDTVKVFDNTTRATVLNPGTLVGVGASDSVSLSVTANYATHYVDTTGQGINITVRYSLSGPDAAQYVLADSVLTLHGNITRRQLYRVDHPDSIKMYDGLTTINSRLDTVYGYISHDIFARPTVSLRDPNVGVNKPVDITYTLQYEDSFCYIKPHDTVMYATVLPRYISLTDVRIESRRTYDGTAVARVLSTGSIDGAVPFDTLTCMVQALFRDANAGDDKTIDVSYYITGENIANYTYKNSGLVLGGEILPIPLTCTRAEADTVKEYDGSVEAHVTVPAYPEGVIRNEQVYLTTRAVYEDSLPGVEKNIWLRYSIYGNGALNYVCPPDSLYTSHGVITGELPEDTTVQDTVSVSNVYDLAVSIYPNPACDIVELTTDEDGEHIIYITDAMGREVTSVVTEGTRMSLSVADLPAGVYFISVDRRSLHKLVKE